MIDHKLFRIADRWSKGETPTEEEITRVHNEFPEVLDQMATFMNALGNIADTDISARQLRHMAARTLGREPCDTSKPSMEYSGVGFNGKSSGIQQIIRNIR